MSYQLKDPLFDTLKARIRVNDLPGKLINIDTLDGGGNSTQSALLAGYLKNIRGVSTVLTKEPTEEEYGQAIRRVLRKERELPPMALQMLFSVDRADHLDRFIIPALLDGVWVVSARYVLSTLAFGVADGLEAGRLLAMNLDYPWPNLNVVLILPVEECLRRIDIRRRRSGTKRELFETGAVLERTLAAYQSLAEELPNVVLVDGTGTEKEVFPRVRQVVEERLLP